MSLDRVLADLRANHDRALSQLIEFASIPSVSTDPAYATDVHAAAAWVAARVASSGPFTVRTLTTAGNPVVWFHRKAGSFLRRKARQAPPRG